jgi:transcription initiation factor TFIIIB Brf1 subunit/transcription initiation factor TFIIB
MYCSSCHKETKIVYDTSLGIPMCAECGAPFEQMSFDRETTTVTRSVMVTIPPEIISAMGFSKDKRNKIRIFYQPNERQIIITKR